MHSEIYRIAYQLSLQGKKPSVALIRARLSKPTSLPDIIEALQQWKLTPELGKDIKPTTSQNEQPPMADTDELTVIKQRLDELDTKVEHILQLLEQTLLDKGKA